MTTLQYYGFEMLTRLKYVIRYIPQLILYGPYDVVNDRIFQPRGIVTLRFTIHHIIICAVNYRMMM